MTESYAPRDLETERRYLRYLSPDRVPGQYQAHLDRELAAQSQRLGPATVRDLLSSIHVWDSWYVEHDAAVAP